MQSPSTITPRGLSIASPHKVGGHFISATWFIWPIVSWSHSLLDWFSAVRNCGSEVKMKGLT